jgi:uncharacterized membrane protein
MTIWVLAPPGAFVHEERPLARVRADRPVSAKLAQRLRAAFDISGSRTFDQDPRFGFVVLGEIASRALSPAVNDPGSALDVIGTALRLLTVWRKSLPSDPSASDDGVRLPPIGYADLLDDVFRPIATDGAASFSVALRLQKAFAALYSEAGARPAVREALLAAAQEAAFRAKTALPTEIDIARVMLVHRQIAAAEVLQEQEASR